MSLRARLVLAMAATSLLSLGGVAGGLHYAAANTTGRSTLAWATVIAVTAALTWSIMVTSWIVDGLTQDHRKIARAVRNFASGDMRTRVGLTSRDPEIEHLARDLDAMMEALSRAMDAQRRFAANAAHELRSPLTTLHGELALALRRDRSADDYRAAISHALEAATDLRALSEDLLDMARTAARPTLREGRRIDVAEIARRAARSTQAELVLSSDDPLLVRGDERDLERMIFNLVDNARRHSPDGGVVVRADARANLVEIAVEDQGIGVDQADADRIFEPFVRLHSEPRSGAGLGLAICKNIAVAHGGAIAIDSSYVSGARFVVTLPRC